MLGLVVQPAYIPPLLLMAGVAVQITPQLLPDREEFESAACETTECLSHDIVVVNFAASEMYVFKMETVDVPKLEIGTVIDSTRNVSWLVMEIEPPAMGERVDLMEEVPGRTEKGRSKRIPR